VSVGAGETFYDTMNESEKLQEIWRYLFRVIGRGKPSQKRKSGPGGIEAKAAAAVAGVHWVQVYYDWRNHKAPRPPYCYRLWRLARKADRQRKMKEQKSETAKRRREKRRQPAVKAKASARHKEWWNSEEGKNWRETYYQREDVKERRRIRDAEKRKDPTFRLIRRMRRRHRKILFAVGDEKSESTDYYLGCTRSFFKKWIKSKFLPGMSFDNAHLWDIDHIQPLSSFNMNDLKEQLKAFHYTNTRPMWRKDNIEKGAKTITHQPELLLDAS
jgi:hypothetical protein